MCARRKKKKKECGTGKKIELFFKGEKTISETSMAKSVNLHHIYHCQLSTMLCIGHNGVNISVTLDRIFMNFNGNTC